MGLARLSLRNPYAVAVLAITVVILGLTTLVRMPVDILPVFTSPGVQVITTYTGMPAEEVEYDITNRLERWTSQAVGIQRQSSRSLIGVSVIKNFFQDNIDPNSALTQVASLALSDLHYLPPGTLPPIMMLFDPTASQPLCLVAVSSDTLNDIQLYDVAYYEIRSLLSGVPGVVAPAVYGGRLREIMIYVNRDRLMARGLSPMDVVDALQKQNVMIPTGDAQIGNYDYVIDSNALVPRVSDLDKIPLKYVNQKPVFISDIGTARDAYMIQTNIVRVGGKHAVYIPIYRQPGANTIQAVEGIKAFLPKMRYLVPHGRHLKLDVLLDQSIYVRQAISGLEREGITGFILAAIAILLFLGNLRYTGIVAVTLPLSLLPAFFLLYFSGQTTNVMTLGGLALAVGMLMDNAIIVLENIARHIEEGERPKRAARNGAAEIAAPVLVATLTLCIVFAPVTLMTGLGKFLFTPLALAVVFALGASYVMALMVVPASCAYFLKPDSGEQGRATLFERGYDRFQQGYNALLARTMRRRNLSIVIIAAFCLAFMLFVPFLGTELFPEVDSGQFTILVRAPSGTRIARTEDFVQQIEDEIKKVIPPHDLRLLVSNIGVVNGLLAAYNPNAGPQDAFVLVQLTKDHVRSSQEYASLLRRDLPNAVPGVDFAFDTAGLIASALNFGRLSPIDVQVTGPDVHVADEIANVVRARMSQIPGAVDVRIQQRLDYPEIYMDVDRTRAASIGLNPNDLVKNVVSVLNSSINFTQNFWVDTTTGNNYFIGATYPENDINSIQTIANIPLTGTAQHTSIPLRDVVTLSNRKTLLEADHVNLRRVVDVYANVERRDVGGVSYDTNRIVKRLSLPKGYTVVQLGQRVAMKESFGSLGFGMVLAVVLVYLAMVTQFRSFVDPLIVLFSVPPAFAGVVGILWITHTTLNVQSMLGTIMVIGLTVSSSVLIVDFANRRLTEGASPFAAVMEASRIRLRPILMTAVAAIFGLIPTAIHSGEANSSLARAVIGGLFVSTAIKMLLLPILYSYWKKPYLAAADEDDEL